jgi:L-threonylcarbamoyladenylate synthase
MKTLKLKRQNMGEVLSECIQALNEGKIIAFPTETFYGLGVKFDDPEALKRLYEIKKRPLEKAMPLIIGDLSLVQTVAEVVSPLETEIMQRYWPGPLTIILKAKEGLSEYITAGTGKVALRVPGESFALELARKAGFPITATSANPSGSPPADSAEMIMKYFATEVDILVDGGRTRGYEPSTIVEVVGDQIKLLRRGVIKKIVGEE